MVVATAATVVMVVVAVVAQGSRTARSLYDGGGVEPDRFNLVTSNGKPKSHRAMAPIKYRAEAIGLGGLAQAVAPSKYQALGFQRPTCAIVFCNPPPSLVDKVGLGQQSRLAKATIVCVVAIKSSTTIVCPLPGRPRGKARELPVTARVNTFSPFKLFRGHVPEEEAGP